MKKINWGIIGAGNISSKFATAIGGVEDANLMAIASRSLDKASQFAEKYHANKAYGSYEEMLQDETIDVVYIGTPHTEHLANAELCIKAGKAVLCEKPFTLNHKDTKYLIDLAREHDVFLMEAMWTKFHPSTKMVKDWISNGKIGKLRGMQINAGFRREFNPEQRLFNPDLGGGALLDIGIYPITYAIHLAEAYPEEISSYAYFGKTNIDEQNTIILNFKEKGILASLNSGISAEVGKDAVIIGESGKIFVKDFWNSNYAILYDNNENIVEEYKDEFETNGYEYEIREVQDCLRAGKKESTVVPLADTLSIMKVMDEIRGQWNFKYKQEQ